MIRCRLLTAVCAVSLIFSCSFLTFHSTIAQAPTPQEITKAQQLFQSGDYDGAIATLEFFIQRNPATQVGWLLLGNAYRRKNNYDKALEMYQKAATFRPTRWAGTFNVAVMHALRNEKEKAFEALSVLRQSGSFDMDQVKLSPDFTALRDDPRFEKLLPTPADFANPFVENVKIIHEMTGENKNDQFGWIARSVGDVDGDKILDFVTSAPTYQHENQAAGRIYVYSGKRGNLLWTQTGQRGENLGQTLEGAGDVNKDRIPDVIAGSPSSNKAYVYSGKEGKLLLTLVGNEPAEAFGSAVNRAGDQNGDGYDDVVIGAPGTPQTTGRAYVYSGRDGKQILALSGERAGDGFGSTVAGIKRGNHALLSVGAPTAGKRPTGKIYLYSGLTSTAKYSLDSDETGARLGMMFLSFVGDVNKDKVPDVYASDWNNSAKGAATGRIYVISGSDGKRLLSLTGENAGDGFGIGSADVGDVNKDGYDDLLIGAWQYATEAPSGGRTYLYSGKDGGILQTLTCRIPGDTFGFDATGIGDVNRDGVIDFLITSAWSGVKGYRSGRVFVISGKR